MKQKQNPVEIYIHIPFCARKCEYCDFLSFQAGRVAQRDYVDALIREIRESGEGEEVSTVFIGGGTPSIVPAGWIAEILDALREKFRILENAEISIEANPGTVDLEKLSAYREAGINRISFGLQSADNGELKRLGRIHSWERFLESYEAARKAGFDNINIDLMSAIPGQTLASWEETLEKCCALNPEHLSAYSLIIEEGTPFYRRYAELEERIADGLTEEELTSFEEGLHLSEEDRLPDEETERDMYDLTARILGRHGYHQYEISNYAKEGRDCRHNIGYWTGVPYYGFGLGASSYIKGSRFSNTDSMEDYIRGNPEKTNVEDLNLEDRMAEFMILGLRMTDGISEREFEERFDQKIDAVYGSILDKYVRLALLERKEDRIRLTREGISLSNAVMAEFLP